MAFAGKIAKWSLSAASKASQYKKYTVQPTGFWKHVNAWLAIDPKRSTGIPLNPQYRNPAPGANDPLLYDDPVTVPAADLAENPYWKRDVRRQYPQLSVVRQPDVVALLSVGSAARPDEAKLLVGDAGAEQLVALKEEGERGLSAFFEKEKGMARGVLGPDGMPPLPTSSAPQGKRYELITESEQSYEGRYPCRTFV